MIRSDEHLIFLLLCSYAIAEYVVSVFNDLTKWLLIDFYLFGEFNLNYLLIGMSYKCDNCKYHQRRSACSRYEAI